MEYIALGYRLVVDCSNAHNFINTIFISFSIGYSTGVLE